MRFDGGIFLEKRQLHRKSCRKYRRGRAIGGVIVDRCHKSHLECIKD